MSVGLAFLQAFGRHASPTSSARHHGEIRRSPLPSPSQPIDPETPVEWEGARSRCSPSAIRVALVVLNGVTNCDGLRYYSVNLTVTEP